MGMFVFVFRGAHGLCALFACGFSDGDKFLFMFPFGHFVFVFGGRVSLPVFAEREHCSCSKSCSVEQLFVFGEQYSSAALLSSQISSFCIPCVLYEFVFRSVHWGAGRF